MLSVGVFPWEGICERSNALFVCASVLSGFHPFFVCGLPKKFPLEHMGSCALNLHSVTVDFSALCGNYSSESVDNKLGTAALFISLMLAMEQKM